MGQKVNNKLIREYIDSEELLLIREKYQSDSNCFYIEIDGADMMYGDTCIDVIKTAFQCPYDYPREISYIGDILFDLAWINKKQIVVVIENLDLILCNENKYSDNIALDYLRTHILPFWNNNDKQASNYCEKYFNVYFIKQ